jgi:adenylate kinase family enzyme
MVVGSSGAGKTVFAERLSRKLGLPLIHLDVHHYLPGWRARPADDGRRCVANLAESYDWIMDGDFSDTYDIRMPRADTLVWLDLPRVTCLRRVLLRLVRDRGRPRNDLPGGCPEQFDANLLRFVWSFPVTGKRRILEAVARFGPHLDVFRLRSHREAEDFLAAAGSR